MKNKGFTLVELLVVIVIIGILAAAAISVFGGGTDKAKLSTLKSDVSAMNSAGTLYLADQGWDNGKAADITLVKSSGYISAIPFNPYLTTANTNNWYAYAGSQLTVGVTTNPIIFSGALLVTDNDTFEKGPGSVYVSYDASTWTGAPQGGGQAWTAAEPAEL